jgi:ribosome-binding factor A
VVADELERLADADERILMVTVTSVDTASDLRTATVYLASLNDDAAEALEERRPQLQRSIGTQVSMKRTPRLAFKADPAIATGNRVEEVLRGLDLTSSSESEPEPESAPEDLATEGPEEPDRQNQ